MEPLQDLAIVLRTIPFQERHRVVTALTEHHGVITALAKNSIQSRRFGGTLEPFAASDWLFTQKPGAEMVNLSEAQIRRPFEGLRKDFERLSLASAFNELILKLAHPHEPAPDLFKLHSNALALLEELPECDPESPVLLALLNGYLAKLLQWSGSQPQLQNCLGCQAPLELMDRAETLSCVVADAGWVCPGCRSLRTRHIGEGRGGAQFHHAFQRVAPIAIWDFQMSLATPIRQIPTQAQASREEHRELFRFLESLFVFHLPGFDKKPLKSLRFLELESAIASS